MSLPIRQLTKSGSPPHNMDQKYPNEKQGLPQQQQQVALPSRQGTGATGTSYASNDSSLAIPNTDVREVCCALQLLSNISNPCHRPLLSSRSGSEHGSTPSATSRTTLKPPRKCTRPTQRSTRRSSRPSLTHCARDPTSTRHLVVSLGYLRI